MGEVTDARAGVVAAPWSVAVGGDFNYPDTSGPKPVGTDLLNRYTRRVTVAAQHDDRIALRFNEVVAMVRRPESLLAPMFALRVLRASMRGPVAVDSECSAGAQRPGGNRPSRRVRTCGRLGVMEFGCADCGCLVDSGVIVAPCEKHPDCCCRDLQQRSDRDGAAKGAVQRAVGAAPDGRGTATMMSEALPRREHDGMSDAAGTCTHLDTVEDVTPSGDGCEGCVRSGSSSWVELRICMKCGHVGCCDSSPGQHATNHWRENPDHPLMRSYEPGGNWWWCYPEELFFEVDGAPPAPSHP